MNDAFDELLLCDVLHFSQAGYRDRSVPGDLGTFYFLDACVPKKVGELAFSLNLQQLRIQLNYDIVFEGSREGSLNGHPVVRWVAKPQKVPISPGIEAEVTGQIDTVLRKQARVPIASCNASSKTFGVSLEEANRGTNVLIATSSVVSRRFEEIVLLGTGGRKFIPPVLVADIKEDRNECGIGAFPGGIAQAVARVTGASLAELQLKWSVNGDATALPPLDQPRLRIQLGTSGLPYQVTLVASADGVSVTVTRTFTPESSWSAAIKNMICNIRRETRLHLLVDPLLDPLPGDPIPGEPFPPRLTAGDIHRWTHLARVMQHESTELLRVLSDLATLPTPEQRRK